MASVIQKGLFLAVLACLTSQALSIFYPENNQVSEKKPRAEKLQQLLHHIRRSQESRLDKRTGKMYTGTGNTDDLWDDMDYTRWTEKKCI